MNRLTKTYRDKTYKIFGVADDLPCGENSYDFKNLLIQKLGEYEDLDEQGLLIKIKPIKDFESRYGVDEFGNVYSFNGKYKNTIIRKPYIHKTNGYVYVNLKQNNEVKNMRVHRLVAEAFIPNPNNYPDINHIDCNKENNCVWNLEWCTRKQNSQHALKNGLLIPPSNVINGVGVNGKNKFIVVTNLLNGESFLENNIKRLTKKLKVGHDFIYYHLKRNEFEFITKNKKYKIQVFLTREEAEKALNKEDNH